MSGELQYDREMKISINTDKVTLLRYYRLMNWGHKMKRFANFFYLASHIILGLKLTIFI